MWINFQQNWPSYRMGWNHTYMYRGGWKFDNITYFIICTGFPTFCEVEYTFCQKSVNNRFKQPCRKSIIIFSSLAFLDPADFEVRLINGDYPGEGLVQSRCPDSNWTTFCAGGTFDKRDADVVCKQTGFGLAEIFGWVSTWSIWHKMGCNHSGIHLWKFTYIYSAIFTPNQNTRVSRVCPSK